VGSVETRTHVVRSGEHLTAIAHRYGVDPDALWNHPANADLNNTRPSRHILAAGDVLQIPLGPRKWMPVRVGSVNKFVAKTPTIKVRVRLNDDDGAIANEPYAVHGQVPSNGTTGGDGSAEFDVSLSEKQVVLELVVRQHSLVLEVGGLDPSSEASGVEARLHNLGYLPRTDGNDPESVVAAIARFQEDAGVEPSGQADSATLAALESKHGC
jgi:hypothetical protein